MGPEAAAAAQSAEAAGGAGGGVAQAPRETPSLPAGAGTKEWFASKGINIHEYTMPLLVEVHRRIHHPPPKGGEWNEAWRRYKDEHLGATKQDILRYAGQLIYEFELVGPVVPYYRQWTQPPPIGEW
jgi:hypothetical protein